ncbi:MAG: LuxR C-terminal-related transcriptional regulator [Thermomicrobiales bacterium]
MTQRAKLQAPAIATDAIVRGRIQTMLDGIPAHRVTLVAAPSGFGKTTAVRQWQQSRAEELHWLTIDQGDADPARLIRHVIATLSAGGADVGRNTLDLLEDTSRPSPEELAKVLADELYEEERTRILVLDECELLHTGPSWDFLEHLIKHAPDSMHVVCISRSDPPLPLARYRTRGQLLELRGSSLQFSQSETEELLDLRTGRRSGDLAAALQRQTHGWPAAVTLATVAFKHRDFQESPASARLEGAPFEALNSLAQDVLAEVNPLDRQAYAMAAIVDPISPAVLAAMLDRPLPECAALLQSMQRTGLASSIADEGYQLHPLFRDLFLHHVVRATPLDVVRLWHERAALALEQQHDITRAVHHWLLAEQQERALDLLESVVPIAFEQEKWGEVAQKLSLLPEGLILDRPSLAFGWGWTLFVRGQWGALDAFMQRVAGVLAAGRWTGDDLPIWRASFDVLATFGIHNSAISPADVVRVLDGVTATLDIDRSLFRGFAEFQRVWALQCLGRSDDALRAADDALVRFGGTVDAAYGRAVFAKVLVLRQQGEIAKAEATALANIDALRQRGFQTACAWLNMLLGGIAYERNDLDLAIARLREAVADYRDVHSLTIRDAMSLLAIAHAIRGEWEASEGIMRRLREILSEFGATELMPGVLITEAWLAQRSGQPLPVFSGDSDSAELARRATTAVILHPAIVRIHLHIGFGDSGSLGAALAELAAMRRVIVETHCVFREPELDLLESVIRWRIGETGEGLRLLRRALRHPSSVFLQREFLNYSADMHAMIGRLRTDARAEGSLPFVAELLKAISATAVAEPADSAHAQHAEPELIRLLTVREFSVLEGLARRLSYKEIAEDLHISPATVKRHAANLYLKLDAANRREAVARAVELGFRY